MIKVDAAGHSDIGKVRRANEDSMLLCESIGLFVVADGMGGHRGGAVASRMATETIGEFMGVENSNSPGDGGFSADLLQMNTQRLLRSITLANKKIYTQSMGDETCRGMGTTISTLYLSGDFMITANVGDSPIYLLRNGEIENLYTPHTLLHEYKKIPKSMEGRYPPGKLAHILTRAVGIRPKVRIDHVKTQCFPGDIIVLCSDGLSGKVSTDEIKDLAHGDDSEAACKKLTELALERGGEDNITVIIVKLMPENGKSSKTVFGRFVGSLKRIGSLFQSKRS